ncbi:methyltransferase domain-containing protein [Limnospira platensis]|uniref:methyltransferase domain-containing protein n=1 Tax=Limnospira platensis TaxID=118562 RepID=UPI0002803DEE|nr:hypothetical protein SPLC1_S131700 [Arthrospira platensis C1]UWU51540.1 Methyltransferase domain-containing protein [Arthrospira platensis C1]
MNQISINDTWTDSDKLRHRDRLAIKYLKGQGIEIGALHKPTQVSSDASVKYVDYKTRSDNLKQYPELQNQSIVETDIIDEAFVLSKVDSGSQDFIIANQVLEHSPNPIGTLEMWIKKLRRGGYLLLSVPIADCCFDKGRPITSLEHMIEDYQLFDSCNIQQIVNVTRSHLQEFIQISGLNIRKKAGLPAATSEQ